MAIRHQVSAILFDCDGVLVDSEVLAQEVETQLLNEIGLFYERREYAARFMGTSEVAFWEALETDGWARLGRSITNELRPPMKQRLRAAFRERLTEVHGAGAAIARITRPKAVASSSTMKSLRIKLKMVGHWAHFVPHIYSSEHVSHSKPAPDLFLHAAAMLNVDPGACLVIEDSINGVVAGRAANMLVWGFTGGGHHHDGSAQSLLAAGAERIVANWADASVLFDAL